MNLLIDIICNQGSLGCQWKPRQLSAVWLWVGYSTIFLLSKSALHMVVALIPLLSVELNTVGAMF